MQHDIKCKVILSNLKEIFRKCTICGWRDDKRLFRWHPESYHPVRTYVVQISEVIHLSRLWSPKKFPHRFVCCRIDFIGCAMPPSKSTNITQRPPIDQSLLKNRITRKDLRKSKASLLDVGCVGVDGLPKVSPPLAEQRQSSWATTAQRHTSAGGENQREFNMDQSCITHE